MNTLILKGRAGHATPITEPPRTAAQAAMLAQWLLYLPGQHPFWNHYTLGCCHLRPIEGVPEANKAYPEAEYEILMAALDPSYQPDAADMETLVALRPINYSHHCHGFTDDQVREIGLGLVKLFVAGGLLAEPQGIYGARELFDDLLREVKIKVAGHA